MMPLSAYDQEPNCGDNKTQKKLWPKSSTYTACRDFACLRIKSTKYSDRNLKSMRSKY
jgi:hypothetical protein